MGQELKGHICTRAIFRRNRKLNWQFKATDLSELKFLRLRIENEGGVITGQNESDLRIHGEISVTRALGNSGPRPMILAKPEHKVFDKDQSEGNFVIKHKIGL